MAVEDLPLEFQPLRERGLSILQRLTGAWTDHNAHDPGITILEQVCYALTDLGYRTHYGLPDLLAGAGGDSYGSLYTPATILPSGPVTVDDLRKIVLDVPGVKNAWIDPVDDRLATYDAALREVRIAGANEDGPGAVRSPNVSDIRPLGLYRVRIEKSDLMDIDGSEIQRAAARRLHRHRGLGEDFVSIDVLDAQAVRLDAALEIAPVGDATDLLATILSRLASYCSPAVPFHTLDEMLARGRRVDEIFEGPLLDHGFIDPDELAAVERRTTLRLSDLIREITGIPGVIAVKRLRFVVNDQVSPDWLLTVDAARAARFDPGGSTIRLERRNLRVDSDALRRAALDLFVERARGAGRPSATTPQERDLPPPAGRDRRVGHYVSIQHQFPATYGIGSAGLPRSAPPERRAQAKQLQAYLMLLDQVLANHFAQLANVGRLLSIHDEVATSYFSQPVEDDPDAPLGLAAVRLNPATHAGTLRRITENPTGEESDVEAAAVRRRNRLLDHLLARVGEQFSDYALLQFGRADSDGLASMRRVARDKQAFLRDYPRIGRDRGQGFNYLEAGAIGSSDLLPGDCLDPKGLASRLSSAAPDAVSAFLWSLCAPEERDRLLSPSATVGQLNAVLLDVLNRALGVQLFEPARFAGVQPSAEARRLLAPGGDGPDLDRRRLNRVLLEDAYPAEIARSRDDRNVSGLELALRRKLGVRDADERFYLVEHILLRPMPGDAGAEGPLFRAASQRDPYSLQITLVFPAWPVRYGDLNFRLFVEETVREQAPAHLGIAIRWLDRGEMERFEEAYGAWMRRWRNHRRAELGL